MPRLSHRAPKLRRHKARNLAYVVLEGRTIYLGKWGSTEAKTGYARKIGEWKAGSKSLPHSEQVSDLTVVEVCVRFMRHAKTYYGETGSEVASFKFSTRELTALYGRMLASEFGPLKLQAVRQAMIEANLCRKLINQRIRRIKAIFKWAASQEIIPASISHGLLTVRGLFAGQSEARETDDVKPVPVAFFNAVEPFVSRQVSAMVQLQELTGLP